MSNPVSRPGALRPGTGRLSPVDGAQVAASPGRRERSKVERRLRIQEAARAVFGEKGFEAATTREIAERADIGAGTLFSYARDKSELLLMIVNDELDVITEAAFATLPRRGSFLKRILHVFKAYYDYWGSAIGLSHNAIHETITFAEASASPLQPEAARFRARTVRLSVEIAALITKDQQSGALGSHVKPAIGARLIIDIFVSEVRRWGTLEGATSADGLARFREVLTLAIAGFEIAKVQSP